MAKLKKQVLGKISGALGDIVFREVNGKNIVGVKPSNISVSNDPESIARRARFALSAKLAQAINKHQKLKDLWAVKAPSGLSTHNFLIKSNYLFVQPSDLSEFIKMVPDAGFPVTSSAVTINSTGVRVAFNAIGDNNYIDPVTEVNVQMLSVAFFSNPVDNSVPAYTLISSSSATQPLSLTEALTFNSQFIGNDELLFAKYGLKKAFNVLVTMNASGNVIHYSNSLTA